MAIWTRPARPETNDHARCSAPVAGVRRPRLVRLEGHFRDRSGVVRRVRGQVMTRTHADIIEGMREVQAKLRELMLAAQALNPLPVEHPGRKYVEADRQRWREMAASIDLASHSKRSKSILIARREGLSAGAAETIRRVI